MKPTPIEKKPAGRLSPGDLPGLDVAVCQALEFAGVEFMEDLATIPIDDLVRCSGLKFTQARTLQYLAGRHLADSAQQRVAAGQDERVPMTDRKRAGSERLSPSEGPSYFEIGQDAEHLEIPDDFGFRRPRGTRPFFGVAGSTADGLDDGGAAGPFA